MKNIAALILVSCLSILSCSKQEENPLPKTEEKEEEKKEIANTDGVTVPGKLDSLLLGSWRYIGSAVDHSPYFFEADPSKESLIIFRNDNSYIASERSRMIDSGRFRVLDTTYYTSSPRRMLNKRSAMIGGTGEPTMYYILLSNDTLSLSHGLGGPKYKRIVK